MFRKVANGLLALVAVVALVVAVAGRPAVVRLAHADEGGSLHDFAEVWNGGVVAANTNILTANASQPLTPYYKLSVLRITVALVTTSSVFNVVETDGTHSFTTSLNGGTALTAGSYYTFVVGARNVASSNGTASTTALHLNFQVATLTTVSILRVEEINAAVD